MGVEIPQNQAVGDPLLYHSARSGKYPLKQGEILPLSKCEYPAVSESIFSGGSSFTDVLGTLYSSLFCVINAKVFLHTEYWHLSSPLGHLNVSQIFERLQRIKREIKSRRIG